MSKLILIYSDGTGQRGGLSPDQKLSNIYKLYRATRPGPASPISPFEQVAFYDPGLGKGEVGGWTFKRVRQGLEAMIGTGIDTNIADCYAKIISFYEPGDQICIFGFSRGAYTVRALASLMNLCGVPRTLPDGSPVPKHGDVLREIAEEAVHQVYNHGAGRKRSQAPYFRQREELGRRFRDKYGSHQNDNPAAVRGNVEPYFIGVFDTVAALGSAKLKTVFAIAVALLLLPFALAFFMNIAWWLLVLFAILVGSVLYWQSNFLRRTRKVFHPLGDGADNVHSDLSKRSTHWAFWKNANYDRYLPAQVKYARHAVAIDEERADFPRVAWGSPRTAKRKESQKPRWLKQVWFAGCHSDIGGSYSEDEARLSDIALNWMVDELKDCVPDIQIQDELLVTHGDPKGLQHRQIFMPVPIVKIPWKTNPRVVAAEGELHPSVIERFEAGPVPLMGAVQDYRPEQLRNHPQVAAYYTESDKADH